VTLLTIPGAVDPHVHLRDLDWSHKATADSETAAALAGGYWAVLDMPNTPPSTTTAQRLASKARHFRARARCDFGLYMGADAAGDGSDYAAAAPCAVGLKMYCDHTTGDLLVDDPSARRRHLLAWSEVTDKPIAVHAEGATLVAVLSLVAQQPARVHFCHVSSAAEVEALREAKRRGMPVTAGVTPHHLYLTEEDGRRLGPFGRVKPPLRTAADVSALWKAVADGTVDVVESDHAPHTRAEKESDDPPYGMPGLETTLPLMVLAVREGRITEERLVELIATNAQRLYGLRPPPDTWTLVDVDASYVVSDSDLRCSSGWSPFAGMRVWGRVREVRIRGALAFDGEDVLSRPGAGVDLATCS
jgi:carbamoyl-phosphate synthase/aspartate carbamoyltransferase/dihydroorotase